MSAMWIFGGIENTHDVYIGKDCMKNFGESLREHAIKIISFEKKKMIPLTISRNRMTRIYNISKKKFTY